MQVTIQIEQNLVKHFSFKQKFLLFLFINNNNNNNNNNNINIYQKQFLHDQELKEGLRMPREKEKLGERQDPRQPPVLLACDKEAEKEKHYIYVYMDVYGYIHIYIYGATILVIAQ